MTAEQIQICLCFYLCSVMVHAKCLLHCAGCSVNGELDQPFEESSHLKNLITSGDHAGDPPDPPGLDPGEYFPVCPDHVDGGDHN